MGCCAEDVLEGRTDRGVAAVASQVLNVYLLAVSVEHKVNEQLEADRAPGESRGSPEGKEGRMSIKRRLRELEEKHTGPQETPEDVEKRRKQKRTQAAHSNDCREGSGEAPLFEIDERGDVFCTHDGRQVTDSRQILAEKFYWMEVGWGGPGLIHDEEAQVFYIPGGQLALSREYVNLERWMGKEREEAWPSEDA